MRGECDGRGRESKENEWIYSQLSIISGGEGHRRGRVSEGVGESVGRERVSPVCHQLLTSVPKVFD